MPTPKCQLLVLMHGPTEMPPAVSITLNVMIGLSVTVGCYWVSWSPEEKRFPWKLKYFFPLKPQQRYTAVTNHVFVGFYAPTETTWRTITTHARILPCLAPYKYPFHPHFFSSALWKLSFRNGSSAALVFLV